GPTIIRAARLRALAHGGQIVVSSTTADMVADRLAPGVALVHLGTHRLKDLARPERVFQLLGPDLRAQFPPLRSVDRVPNNLPLQQTTFIGRDAVMQDVGRLLDEHSMVTLTGAGGSGKTRLAIQVAAERMDHHPDGLWLVDLGPVNDPGLVPNVVAAAVGVPELPVQPLVETLVQRLESQDLLLILDNCEHLIDACVELADRLLRSCVRLTILATSREPLGLDGEAVLRLPSLEIPSVADDTSAEAFRLFVDRATLARSTFSLDDEGAAAVVQICRRLDGIPLAIELAAARTRALSPHAIASQLTSRFALVGGGRRGALPRQRTLEASVDWSYELLGDEERTLLQRLSVFAGPFTLPAAEGVCPDDELPASWIVEGLTSLVDKSLVQVHDDAADARFRMLETVRFYAGQRLVSSGDAAAYKDRHLAWFVALAEGAEAELLGPTMGVCRERLDADIDNLRAAHDWGMESGRVGAVLRMAASLRVFWASRHAREFVDRVGDAVALEDVDPRDRAMVLMGVGWALWTLGELQSAQMHAEEALAVAETVGDSRLVARAKEMLGWQLVQRVDDRARAMFEESIDELRANDDRWFLVDALAGLVVTNVYAGELAVAQRWSGETVEVAERHGNAFELAQAYAGDGTVAAWAGRFDEAAAALDRSLAAARDIDDDLMQTVSGVVKAFVAAQRGEPWRAMLEEVEAEAERRVVAYSMLWAATVGCWAAHRDAPPGADPSALDRAEAMAPLIGAPWATAFCRSIRADIALDAGDVGAARAFADEAVATARATPFGRLPLGQCLLTGARVARAEGDLRRAEDETHEALSFFLQMPRPPSVPEALEVLAVIAGDQESDAEACRLLAASDTARAALGYPRPARETRPYEAVRDLARTRLTPDAFQAAWDDGSKLSLDEGVAYATRARGERKRPSVGWASLTPTEVTVVRAVCEGLSNPEIGERLLISRSTVKTHLEHVFAKVGINSRSQLAAEAAQRDL
ncbi:MAG TPA: LuxR C-terminal-related transcriptional regulator, partial [Acidimicrobiales bacterium]|nr:LuxR C-terminal-related transcriptional regulator [Acidimicrobiales bacterium]